MGYQCHTKGSHTGKKKICLWKSSVHHQLPAPPPHHPDGGPPLLLRSVDPLHLIHLPIEGFCEVAGEVEIKVLKGLLMSFVLVASTYSSNQFVSVRMRAA